ncbi:MAG TPA: M23 family metallopeptidase [Vicinamibacterales bacterium]|nr:M23 family metallopeptidase [Vicinamibacterales bacterium]
MTIPLGPTLGITASALILPILIGLGARWSAKSALDELTTTNARLTMENDSYREATGQLAAQISTLQAAVDEIGATAAVDPAASRAMEKLPAAVRSRAIGGGVAGAVIGSAFGPGDAAFAVMRDVLGAIEDRLDAVRSDVEKRRSLADATPSIWPVAGWLTSSFGNRRDPFNGGSDFHPGLDISANQGDPVLAPAAGIVSSAGPSGNYGNLVVVDHGFGIVTKYGHLSRFAVMNGQQVNRGDIIGYVGSTGRSTSPHLHYEIWVNDKLTNPMRLLGPK